MAASAAFVIEFAGLTDVGRARSRNEDSYTVCPELGLALVCDGMGGHAGGDVASRTAAETIIDFLYEYDPENIEDQTAVDPFDSDEPMEEDEEPEPAEDGTVPFPGVGQAISTIRAAVQRANRALVTMNQERGFADGRGMGTTVVGYRIVEGTDKLVVFHAGDSRLYRLRGGQLQQLTRDHSLYQAWLDSGGHGQAPQRNIIVRALGTMRDIQPEVSLQAVAAGDIFLLCSDGLTSMLTEPEITQILKSSDNLQDVCQGLIALANQKGGYDNITVVLGRCKAA